MKTPKSSETGQVLILLAVGIVALLGFTALAIDGGAIFFDRRSAQNAADAAALAGAYELAFDPWAYTQTAKDHLDYRIECLSKQRAQANHYGTVSCDVSTYSTITDNGMVTVEYPPTTPVNYVTVDGALDSDLTNYVRVTITSTVNTSFLHFVFPGPVQNTVEAVAHVVKPYPGPAFKGSGMVALRPHGTGLTIGGTADTIMMGGGVFVNSDSNAKNDYAVSGGSESLRFITRNLTVVGGIDPNTSGSTGFLVVPGPANSPDPSAVLSYPPNIGIPAVPNCTDTSQITGTTVVKDPDGTDITYDVYSPGNMTGFPSGNVYFSPGIYCITMLEHGNRTMNNSDRFYNDPTDPERVLIVMTGYNPCNFTFNGGALIRIKGYGYQPYEGLAIYIDPGSWTPATTGSSDATFTLNGNGDSYINGTIYAPTCTLKLNGTGGSFYQGQVVGYDITLSGTKSINMTYIAEDNVDAQPFGKIDLNQ